MSILYKITTPDGRISHLFGTIHLNDEAYVTLPLEVKHAFEQATDCVFEMNISFSDTTHEKLRTLEKTWIDSNTPFLSQIPQDYISSAAKTLETAYNKTHNTAGAAGLSILMQQILQIPPIRVTELKTAENQREPVKDLPRDALDAQLQLNAKWSGKRIGYLESLEEQVTATTGYHLNILEQIEFYRFITSELDKGRRFPTMEDTERAYQQQDIQKMQDMQRVFSTTSTVPEPVRRYYDGCTIARDLKMAERMKPYLNNGNAFVAVGAAHLKGITDQLQTEGYTIEAVALGKRRYPIEVPIEEFDKVAAFKKIYTALYMAQTSFFKKRGHNPAGNPILSLKQIQNYTAKNKDTRSYKAWELAEKHYKNISSANGELLKSICKEGYAKSSSFCLFRQTKTNLDDAQSVANASAKIRTGSVRDVLDASPR